MDVRIYRPSKSVMQSGRAKSESWVLEYELKSARRPEPLMGWVASGDTLNQVRLKFPTLDEAKDFANSKGWGYTIQPDQNRKITPKNYVDNFKYISSEESAV